MKGSTLFKREPVRMMIVGYPGMAKTGSLASLANMGYKLRIADYDGNYAALLQHTKPEFLDNIDIVTLEDKLRSSQKFMEVSGIPDAFMRGVKLLDRWKYKEEDGTEVDLGASKDWGCDTIFVLDSNSAMGVAAFRRVMSLLNKTPTNMTQQGWGIAMKEQDEFLERVTSTTNRFHVIVLNHLKMIGPKDIQAQDDELTKSLKGRIADLVPTRLFPNALGQGLPQNIAGHFPNVIEATVNKKGQRVFLTQPRQELDLKLAMLDAKPEYPISDGLATIFAAIAPPIGDCANSSTTSGEEKEKVNE